MLHVVCVSFLFFSFFSVPVCCLNSWRRETSLLYQQQKAVRFCMNTDFKHYLPVIFVCMISNPLLFKTTFTLLISLVERQNAQIVAASADTEAFHRFQVLPTASNTIGKALAARVSPPSHLGNAACLCCALVSADAAMTWSWPYCVCIVR